MLYNTIGGSIEKKIRNSLRKITSLQFSLRFQLILCFIMSVSDSDVSDAEASGSSLVNPSSLSTSSGEFSGLSSEESLSFSSDDEPLVVELRQLIQGGEPLPPPRVGRASSRK